MRQWSCIQSANITRRALFAYIHETESTRYLLRDNTDTIQMQWRPAQNTQQRVILGPSKYICPHIPGYTGFIAVGMDWSLETYPQLSMVGLVFLSRKVCYMHTLKSARGALIVFLLPSLFTPNTLSAMWYECWRRSLLLSDFNVGQIHTKRMKDQQFHTWSTAKSSHFQRKFRPVNI